MLGSTPCRDQKLRIDNWPVVLLITIGLLIACGQEQPPSVPYTPSPILPLTNTIEANPVTPIDKEATQTLDTSVVTTMPTQVIVQMAEPIGSVAFLYEGRLWLMDETETAVQSIPLTADDAQLTETLVWSPDRSKLAWLGVTARELEAMRSERRNMRFAYPVMLNLETGMLRRYLNVPAVPRGGLAWSADSQWLYFKPYETSAGLQGNLYGLDIVSGETQSLIDARVGGGYVLATGDLILTSDGMLVFVSIRSASTTWRLGLPVITGLDIDTGRITTSTEITTEPIFYGDWDYSTPWDTLRLPMSLSRQDDMIAYSVAMDLDPNSRSQDIWGLYLLDQVGGTPQRVSNDLGLGRPFWSPDGQRLAVAGGVAENAVFLVYDRKTGLVTRFVSQEWQQLQNLVNPEALPLNYLHLSPVAWLGNERLIVKASLLPMEAQHEKQILLTLDLGTNSVQIPSWLEAGE